MKLGHSQVEIWGCFWYNKIVDNCKRGGLAKEKRLIKLQSHVEVKEIIMSIVPNRNGLRNNKWMSILDECVVKYVKNYGWSYDLSNENKQPKGQDCEARYLSQFIFKFLLEEKDSVLLHTTCDRYAMLELDRNNKIRIHFDVMNNPKTCHEFSASMKDKDYKHWVWWKDNYHVIGNLVPIPWPDKLKINNQLKHLQLDERWDMFLRYMRTEWKNWYADEKFSFERYMILTCQHMYYEEIFDDLKKMLEGKSLDDVSIDEWIDFLDSEEKKIDVNSKLLKFDIKKNETERINFLIEVRSRIIVAILQKRIILL